MSPESKIQNSKSAALRVIVVGAGISGLAFAYRVSRLATAASRKLELLLLEASPRAGGVIRTIRHADCLLEAGPDCWAGNKPAGVELCRELGLEDGLIGVQAGARRSLILHKGALKPLPEGFFLLSPMSLRALAATRVLSPAGKLRMALELLVPRRRQEGDESLAAFVRRRFGREALERIAQPMVAGIYTADPEKLSLHATFPQFAQFEKQGSVIRALRRRARANAQDAQAAGPRYGMFVTLAEGLQTLPDTLAGALPGGALRLNTNVSALQRRGEGWLVRTGDGALHEADVLCLALPAPAAGRLLAGAAPELAAKLGEFAYAGAAVVNFVFDRAQVAHPMDAIGAVIPAVEKRRILAFSFSNVKFAGRAPAGKAVIRAFLGGALQPGLAALPADELRAIALDELRSLLGVDGEPAFTHVAAHGGAMAQYHVGHAGRVAEVHALAARQPGLRLIGNAYDGVGIPDCIRGAEAAARTLFA